MTCLFELDSESSIFEPHMYTWLRVGQVIVVSAELRKTLNVGKVYSRFIDCIAGYTLLQLDDHERDELLTPVDVRRFRSFTALCRG